MQAGDARLWRCSARMAGSAVAALLALHATAQAGEYEAVEVGTTGLVLGNSAPHQQKLYLKAEDALMDRVCCLLGDMDQLLAKLHALPPQLSGSTVLTDPPDSALAELYTLALTHNPRLQQMRLELGMLAARTRQAGAKTDPSLTLMFEDLPAPVPLPMVFHKPPEQGFTVGLSQMFDSYGKRKIKRQIAAKDEEIKELEIESMELDMLWDVGNMYFGILDVKARRRSLEANIALMRLLLDLGRIKYAAGFTMQAEVLNGEVQLSAMEQMLAEMVTMEQQMGVRLAGMLGTPPGFQAEALCLPGAYPLPPSSEFDAAALCEEAVSRRPDGRGVELGVARAELEIRMAKADYHPDYELMAEYMMAPGMHDSIRAGVSFPLSLHKEERQDAKVQEMYAEGEMTRSEAEVINNTVLTEIRDLQLELGLKSRLADMYRGALVPQARLALESAIRAYSADMMDFSDLLMAQQNLLTQQTELERSYISILRTLASLQVITAGAFDPTPYMLATTEFEAPTAVESLPDLRRSELVPDSEAETDQEGTFVSDLQLPGRGGSESNGHEGSSQGEDAASESDESRDFYRPFSPGKGSAE